MWKKRLIYCLIISGMAFIACSNGQVAPSIGEIQTAAWNEVSTLAYGSTTQESLNSTQTQIALEITPTTTANFAPDLSFHAAETIPFEQSKILTQSEFPKDEKVNVTLPRIAGNYLVFLAGHGYEYVSLDGTIRGQFLEFSAEQLGLASLTLGDDPRLIFVSTASDPDEQRLKNLSIFETGLDGSPLGAWVGNLSSDYWCIEPIGRIVNFPDPAFFLDNWFAVDCFHAGGHSINLVNLKLGSVKSIFINCKFVGDITFMPYVDTQSSFFWSETGTEFAYHCPFGEYYFVSILNDQAIVRQVGDGRLRILSVSPDWKKIAFDMGYTPQNADGTTSGRRIAVADLECMLEKNDCAKPVVYDLPFLKPFDPFEDDYSLDWMAKFTSASDKLVWALPGITGWIDLATQNNHIGRHGIGGYVKDISPDGKTILFLGDNPDDPGYAYLFVVRAGEDNYIRYLAKAENMAGFIRPSGWLTIP